MSSSSLVSVCQYIGLFGICFYFINQPCTLYIAFDKCFYICDVVVVKSFYITLLIQKKKQSAFQVHA